MTADLLLAATVKVSLVLLAGLVVVGLLRRRSAAARHWVLSVAVLCALLLPAVWAVGPTWSMPSAVPPVEVMWSGSIEALLGGANGADGAPATGSPASGQVASGPRGPQRVRCVGPAHPALLRPAIRSGDQRDLRVAGRRRRRGRAAVGRVRAAGLAARPRHAGGRGALARAGRRDWRRARSVAARPGAAEPPSDVAGDLGPDAAEGPAAGRRRALARAAHAGGPRARAGPREAGRLGVAGVRRAAPRGAVVQPADLDRAPAPAARQRARVRRRRCSVSGWPAPPMRPSCWTWCRSCGRVGRSGRPVWPWPVPPVSKGESPP